MKVITLAETTSVLVERTMTKDTVEVRSLCQLSCKAEDRRKR